MRDFAETDYANVHRGVHYLSGAATDRYEAARRTVQKFLSAAHRRTRSSSPRAAPRRSIWSPIPIWRR